MLVQRQSHVVVFVHVVWATADRESCLPESLDPVLRALVHEHARDGGGAALAVGCASDHVHAVVRLPSTLTLATLVQYLKGKTSYAANKRGLLPRPLQWQAGYSALSVDPGLWTRSPPTSATNAPSTAHHPRSPA